MRVLFVYRVFKPDYKDPVVESQAEALLKEGLDLTLFPIKNGGSGYIKAYFSLRKFLKKTSFDIIHGHYSYCGFIAACAFKGKKVCSLMGSDIYIENFFFKRLTKFFSKYIWDLTIVKSSRMNKEVLKSFIVPNGVDYEKYKPIEKTAAFQFTNFNPNKFNIIFVAYDIHSVIKNFKLAKEAVFSLNNSSLELIPVSNVNHEDLIYYYNSADLLLLTSLSEGSPNVIKEAMACNCPIVATDVGDVSEVIDETDSCYLSSFEVVDLANKISNVIEFNSRTNGREKIQHLNSKSISKKLIYLYEKLLKEDYDSNC